MDVVGTFPFGEPVRLVEQEDRSTKRVFVLGVYASAVHARWVGADGRPLGEARGTPQAKRSRQVVQALAVASEPYIFWRGDGVEEIVKGIGIPDELGTLKAADRRMNGPSGIVLDEGILAPMGISRDDAWLCDLVPHSCMNSSQEKAIRRAYNPLVEEHGLPAASVPRVPTRLSDSVRRDEIARELQESGAELLVLLGDKPIQWFLRFYDERWARLSDFGTTAERYGQVHRVTVAGREISVLPVAHPRQIAKLGRSSERWYGLHRAWVSGQPQGLLR